MSGYLSLLSDLVGHPYLVTFARVFSPGMVSFTGNSPLFAHVF